MTVSQNRDAQLPLWTPSSERMRSSQMYDFMASCNAAHGLALGDFPSLHRWSTEEIGLFWSAVWSFCEVKGQAGDKAFVAGSTMLEAKFFPQATLNYAENLLSRSGTTDALVFRGEDKVSDRWSWDRLRNTVSQAQQAFRAAGIRPGDRIAAMLPNMPETVALMLAAASLGAIWSSCSPDFGEQGAFERFGQIEPSLFIACDGYWYSGRRHDVREKARNVRRRLGVPGILVRYVGLADDPDLADGLQPLEVLLSAYEAAELHFERFAFDHPLFILFSSGTTGAPKCIVHSAGGTLIQHLKEHRIHCDLRPGEKLFYYTTCGWMMWNWMVSGLASGATLCLFDGSPFWPNVEALFDYSDAEGFAVFGTSAKYLDAVRKSGAKPRSTHILSTIRLLLSTGSPLSSECFEYVYEAVKSDVQLASVSGGTDIVSCFVLGNPFQAVWSGEIQGPGLGLAVDVWGEDAKPLPSGKGELVCTKPFPSMPLAFWNDLGRARYRDAYFSRFDAVWCQGDFAETTGRGGFVIHGRSDATLNPGGVRIGTAEIYNVVEQMEEVSEAICVGQEWENDVRVVLFVRLAPGIALDETLTRSIKSQIRAMASPRHVPAKIVAVTDIPRTKSGKIVELAVREVVHGRPVKNIEALANPEALTLFAGIRELSV